MITQQEIIEVINIVLVKRGKESIETNLEINLRTHGFRSMDFSEVALRLEDRAGRELNFDAQQMRAITTFADVVDFFLKSLEM
jgi:acyl carrier protein